VAGRVWVSLDLKMSVEYRGYTKGLEKLMHWTLIMRHIIDDVKPSHY
jgi:hypothetical protein